MSNSRIMKLVTGFFEAFLGIPIIGGSVVIGLSYTPLIVMFILHVITLFISNRHRVTSLGSILGIVTSLIAWIPLVGWLMHVITALVLLSDGFFKSSRTYVERKQIN